MKFVKEVLQIIPKTVFEILEDVIELLTEKIKKIPSKFAKAELKEMLRE